MYNPVVTLLLQGYQQYNGYGDTTNGGATGTNTANTASTTSSNNDYITSLVGLLVNAHNNSLNNVVKRSSTSNSSTSSGSGSGSGSGGKSTKSKSSSSNSYIQEYVLNILSHLLSYESIYGNQGLESVVTYQNNKGNKGSNGGNGGCDSVGSLEVRS